MVACGALSVVVHVPVVWGLWWALEAGAGGAGERGGVRRRPVERVLQLVKPEEDKPMPFAKTSADAPEVLPEVADFVGERNTAESAAADAPQRVSDAPRPTLDGVEREDTAMADQERQDGDLQHEALAAALPPVPPAGGALPPFQPQTPQPVPDESTPEAPAEGAASVLPMPPEAEGDVRVSSPVDNSEQRQPEQQVAEEQTLPQPLPAADEPATQLPVYDPSLAPHMQPDAPGFRTHERRSRSTGRFVVGRNPALNVAATPQGHYEQEVYRRIAYQWYIACDDHRGDIVPGSIVISIRINRQGRLHNMELIRRTGAGVSQQAFTFAAIRRAALPPMPPAVRQEIVGELLELIFQFNFD